MEPIRVRVLFGWNPPHQNDVMDVISKNFPNKDFIWKDLLFVNTDDADYFVIFANTSNLVSNFYKPEKTILFQTEPEKLFRSKTIKEGKFFRNLSLNNGGFSLFPTWYMDVDYNFLSNRANKTKVLSSILSDKASLDGQILRSTFARNKLDGKPYYDHYGRNQQSFKSFKGTLVSKHDGLIPYKYHFAAENTRQRGWLTEKIIDPLLCECLAFYDGCPNIDEYVNPEAIIKINLDRQEEALGIIEKSIRDNEWEKRLPAILDEKNKWMNENNAMNIIWKVIRGYM